MSKASKTDMAHTGQLDDDQLDAVVGGSTPHRISNNLTTTRQTPQMDFGDRMNAGLDTAAGVLANGAAVVGGVIPGGAIISAAVSSVGAMTNTGTPVGVAASSYA